MLARSVVRVIQILGGPRGAKPAGFCNPQGAGEYQYPSYDLPMGSDDESANEVKNLSVIATRERRGRAARASSVFAPVRPKLGCVQLWLGTN